MPLLFAPQTYAHIPPALWPVVFMRLCAVYAWALFHDVDVICRVNTAGEICVHILTHDPNDLSTWLHAQSNAPTPHLDYCENGAGALDVNPWVLAMARLLERMGHLERWIWVRVVLPALPPFEDSS